MRFCFFCFWAKIDLSGHCFQDKGLYIIKHWLLVVSVRLKHPSSSCCACLLGNEKSAEVILAPCLVLTKMSSKLQRIKVQRSCQEAAFFAYPQAVLIASFYKQLASFIHAWFKWLWKVLFFIYSSGSVQTLYCQGICTQLFAFKEPGF